MIEIRNIPEFNNKDLPIVEIFGSTLQGEGPRLRPAIFIRTGFCNFTCRGFGCEREAPDKTNIIGCDTIHAVSKKFKDQWVMYSHFNDIVERAKPLIHPNPDIKQDIIITGGEPTLHWDNKVLQELIEYYVSRGHHVIIETNGSRLIEFTREYQHEVQFSVSVKLAISGEAKKKRINIPAIQAMLSNGSQSYLKFVVGPDNWDETKTEIFEILTALPTYADVFLMPLGETRNKQLENTQFVFDKCAELGFSFSPRIHILAYDDKDGV